MHHRVASATVCVLTALELAACSQDAPTALGAGGGPGFTCSIPESLILSGGPGKDGIPALTQPELVGPAEPGTEYLRDLDRVIGLDLEGVQIAVPLNILWWHEIVNLRLDTLGLAVTHCPLTGSSLVFDRGPVGDPEFGVSGLLYLNNLIMYDRSTGESLWPQMARGARCGPRRGTDLTMLPAIEMTWAGWHALHPNTRVVSSATGHSRNYRLYPYGRYAEPGNAELLFPIPGGIDSRRPPKERVLGIPMPGAGLALPFGELRDAGAFAGGLAAVDAVLLDGRAVVVFWDAAAEAAMAYEVVVDGERLSFHVDGGRILDEETGSVWRVDGQATEGPLRSQRLRPVAEAYVAYWFAWQAFHPDTELWESS
ncbi:MAG: DUF3179 domain-containing protein [Longimicrobiales bacterium]